MMPPANRKCHHTGFEKNCRALVADGICERWVHWPGPSPFKTVPKEGDWMCEDRAVLMVAGDAAQQAHGGHTATTVFREMIFNKTFREQQLGAPDELKTLEAPHADHDYRS